MPVSVRKFLGGKVRNFACGICAAQQRLLAKRVPYDTNIEKGHRDKSNKTVGPARRFGSNPGALTSRTYIPAHFRKGRPLVVVLHGSMQTAEDYNRGTGWSALADLHSFALLFPEQTRSNNAIRGFNWFELDDNRRGAGEPLSIRQMI